MNEVIQAILERHDRGELVSAISHAESVGFGYVYSTLRRYRPNRPRAPRTRTSQRRKLILGLLAQGIAPPRVAFLAECTPAYVYKLQQEGIAA
jgi:hypothetical protein